MLDLIKRNQKYFEELNYKNNNLAYKKDIIKSIQKYNITVLSGFKLFFSSNLISYIILNSNFKYKYLYLNKNLDLENLIKNWNSIEFILLHLDKNIKIIILENFELILDLKSFFNHTNKNNIKVLFITNILDTLEFKQKIKEKKEINYITILENKVYDLKKYQIINKQMELLKTENLINSEIIKNYKLKNTTLYKYTLIFLAKLNQKSSIREINRNLNKNIKISLITMMEYFKYSVESQIIHKIQSFDFKKNKEIKTRIIFYFSSINFRNSLYNFELSQCILKKNFLYNQLQKNWYKIYSWLNWSYQFDFYGYKTLNGWSISNLNLLKSKEIFIEIKTIFIDFCKTTDKKGIKIQINKLLKVEEKIIKSENNLTQTFSKYLILENPKELWIKKLNYENLKIISFDELLKSI